MDAEKNLEKLVERQRAYFAEGKTLSVDMRLQALERLEKAGLLTRRENPENRVNDLDELNEKTMVTKIGK